MAVEICDSVRAFLEEPRYAVVATINPNGTPQQSVMWYELRGDTIMMNTTNDRVKYRNLRRDPRISICWEETYKSVVVTGTVSFVEDPETTQADIYHLAHRYNPIFDEQRWAYFKKQTRITLLVEIDRLVTHRF